MKHLILLILIIMLIGGIYSVSKNTIPSVLERVVPTKISHKQAIENVKNLPEVQQFLKDVPNGRVEVDNELEGEINVHVYEIKDGHTATFNWYKVDKITGAVKEEF